MKIVPFSFEYVSQVGKACLAIADSELSEALLQSAHPKELERASHFLNPERKSSFLRGRYLTHQALHALLKGNVPHDSFLKNGILGQPVLFGNLTGQPIEVSLAHSGHWAGALAFTSLCPMAVDIEMIPERDSKVLEAMRSQMTLQELAWVDAAAGWDCHRLTALWTAKESLSKILKCGLTAPIAFFETKKQENIICQAYHFEFKNFVQFRTVSWVMEDAIFSLTYPKCLRLNISELGISGFQNNGDSFDEIFR